MRIVCISDTHGKHDAVLVPPGDVLIHSGDFSTGPERSVVAFNNFLATLPHPHKIVIAGNHDQLLEREPDKKNLITNATYLVDERIDIDGVVFYGSPYTMKFHGAFQVSKGEEATRKFDSIPNETDILITHGPPHFIGDRTWTMVNAGSSELALKIKQVKPLVHLFGHIHEGYGIYHESETMFVNASIANFAYRSWNKPIVFDLDEKLLDREERRNSVRVISGPASSGSCSIL